jgi:phage baseplate assembly protein W
MAFGAQKIFPIDKKPSTAVGVGLPFNAPGVFRSTYITKDAIKNNLINFFLTNNGERYLNPTFGGNLRAFIFQQITDNNLEGLKEEIQNQLGTYFPNVFISQLDILQNPDTNSISVELTYKIINTNIQDEIQLQFN